MVILGCFVVVCSGLQYFSGPALVESLDKTCTRYKMEISAKKTKLMTNSANGIQRELKVFSTVTSFRYSWSSCFR